MNENKNIRKAYPLNDGEEEPEPFPVMNTLKNNIDQGIDSLENDSEEIAPEMITENPGRYALRSSHKVPNLPNVMPNPMEYVRQKE